MLVIYFGKCLFSLIFSSLLLSIDQTNDAVMTKEGCFKLVNFTPPPSRLILMMGLFICKYETLWQEVSVESLILRWPLRSAGLLIYSFLSRWYMYLGWSRSSVPPATTVAKWDSPSDKTAHTEDLCQLCVFVAILQFFCISMNLSFTIINMNWSVRCIK